MAVCIGLIYPFIRGVCLRDAFLGGPSINGVATQKFMCINMPRDVVCAAGVFVYQVVRFQFVSLCVCENISE